MKNIFKKINLKKLSPIFISINIIVAILLINVIVNYYPFLRIDFSQGRIHSLSPVSKKIIKNLDDVVNIKVYMTQDLPADVRPIANNLKTILNEFERNNKSRLKISYVDPTKNEAAKTEADQIGIQKLQFSTMQSNKLEVASGYLGLSVTYGDKKLVLPIASDVNNLEYFLISGIKKVTTKQTQKVALAEEAGTLTKSEITYFRKFLEQTYTVSDVSIDTEGQIPEDAIALVIAGRKGKLSDKSLEKIKKWVDSGKGLIIFQDSVDVNSAMQATKIPETGLEKILKENGIEIEQKIIVDESAAPANFRTNQGAFLIKYPYWIQVRPENISKNIPVLSGITSLIFEWASPIKLSGDAKELFSSSPNSVLDDSFTNLSPISQFHFSEDKSKYTIGAIKSNEKTKLAVISDYDFIKDQFVINNEQNLGLALNMVDYFSQDSSLMEIRTKAIKSSPIAPTSDLIKLVTKYANIILPIIILIISAITVKILRKKNNSNW